MSYAGATGSTDRGKPLIKKSDVETPESKLHQQIQRNVGEISKQVDLIQKQTNKLQLNLGAGTNIGEARGEVQNARNAAQKLAIETTALLNGISADAKGISSQEQKLRQAKHQKLTENLGSISDRVKVAFEEYAKAEAVAQAAAPLEPKTGVQRSTGGNPFFAGSRNADARAPVNTAQFGVDDAGRVQPKRRNSSAGGVELEEGGGSDGSHGGIAGPRQQIVNDISEAEVSMHTAIVSETAHDINNINQNTADLNYVMRTMAELTHDQGQVIDNIESNMSRAEDDSRGAVEQLVQASSTQRTGIKRIWWILLFFLIVLIVLVSILILNKKK